MPSLKTTTLFTIATAFLVFPVAAATFIVPPDRDLIHRADAIVTGTALPSYSRLTPLGGIETVTPFDVDEVLAGDVGKNVIDIVEPGGVAGNRATIIPGVPSFVSGSHLLLMLSRTGTDRWTVTELVLGKFRFHTEGTEPLLLRDAAEIAGWDRQGNAHHEPRRSASRFMQFIRDERRGGFPPAAYFVGDATSFSATTEAAMQYAQPSRFLPAPAAIYSATSYTMIMANNLGGRWTTFPAGVPFYMGTVQEPGAPGGGVTAIQTAFASWNNDAGSNVNYVYAGVDNGTHTQGLHTNDGANTILFERDLSFWGVGPFTCTSTSYGGTLGIGGVSLTSGQNQLGAETFYTIAEADVEMNRGIANCTLLFNNGDWNSAVTHEVGHTLGFRHADQNRSNGACTADLECSSSAIMTAVVTPRLNAALQPWDINAVRALYPGGGGVPPTIASIAPASGSAGTAVTITGSNFVAGATVYIGGAPASNVFVASSTQITANVPALPGGTVSDVTVVTSGGTATLPKAFFVNFYDVAATHPYRSFVEKVVRAGITAGCGGGNYCPDQAVTRDQMAVFLLRAKHGASYTPPPATGTMFRDVPANAFAAAFIEELAREGITSGCGSGNYCPTAVVTRAQMSVFLLLAKYGSTYTPPPATGTMFADVPANSFGAAFIEELAREGITGGCDATHFCPNSPTTRGQMAVFLSSTFGL